MSAENRGLMVRRTERREISLPAQVCVAPQHATAVRLSRGSGHREGWLDAGIVDLSSRGVGRVTEGFLPRGSRVRVRVREVATEGEPGVLAECVGRVARVSMTDRRPGYMLGLALTDVSPDQSAKLDELIERFADAPAEGAVDA